MKKLNNNQALKWLAKQGEEVQLQIMANVFEFRMTYINNCRRDGGKLGKDPKRELEFLVSGIQKAFKESDIKSLSVFDDLELVDENKLAAALAKQQRKAPKRNRVMNDLREVVERLRNENISWQGVADYIALHHKRKISRGYLHRLFAVRF